MCKNWSCSSIAAGEDETDWYSELRNAIAAEQGTDSAVQGSAGMTGFTPSANHAWRDADFRAQHPDGRALNGNHGYSNQQPDINEQGWMPR